VPTLSLHARIATLWLLATSAIACAPRWQQVDVVTAAPGGAWLAGSEGVAAFTDGTSIVRRDYPVKPFDDAYEPFSIPAARVVLYAGEPWLFTRSGTVFRWSAGSWIAASAQLPWAREKGVQVDQALLAPDGGVVVQLHGDRLLSTTAIGAAWREERLPGYCDRIAFVGDTLFAVGWQGDTRAVFRRSPAGRWEVAALLRADDGFRDPYAIVRTPGGPPAVVASNGVYVLEEGGPRFVPADAIAAGVHPAPAVVQVAAAEPAKTAVVARPAAVASQVAAPAARPSTWITGVATAAGHGPLLFLGGKVTGVAELGLREVTVMPCDPQMNFVGAVASGDALRVVTQYGALWNVTPSGCTCIGRQVLIAADDAPGQCR
jgi:hypothetical protein